MPSLLSASDQAAVFSALQDVADTFFKHRIAIRKRGSIQAHTFGEQIGSTDNDVPLRCLMVPSRGLNSSYETVESTQKGSQFQDGWHVYIWKADADKVNLVIDPEADQCVIDGKPYHIYMFTPTAQFADLDMLLWEFEVHFHTR